LSIDGPRHCPSRPRIDDNLAIKAGLAICVERPSMVMLPRSYAGVKSSRLENTHLSGLDERMIGALMMHFMIETILATKLVGVNPFDRPAI
jgi:hypothetical protein